MAHGQSNQPVCFIGRVREPFLAPNCFLHRGAIETSFQNTLAGIAVRVKLREERHLDAIRCSSRTDLTCFHASDEWEIDRVARVIMLQSSVPDLLRHLPERPAHVTLGEGSD